MHNCSESLPYPATLLGPKSRIYFLAHSFHNDLVGYTISHRVYLKRTPVKGELSIMAKAIGKPRPRKSLADLEPPPRTKRPESLTSREQEILELIWAGFKNKEIGHRLKISVKTVEAHRANMMKKMRVSNTAQLLKTAIQGGALRVR